MSTPATPSTPTPAGDDRNLVAVDATTAATFEDKVELFWRKNRTAIYVLCVAIVLVMVGREGWKYLARQKQLEIEKAYAAATTPEQLKAFATAHPKHTLGGIAHLRMADEAYKAGRPFDAVSSYDRAIAVLTEGPLAARARLGRALAKLQAGETAEGQTDLKKLVENTALLKAVQAEAAYHLTSLAVEAGNAVEAQKYVDLLMKLDPTNPWTQRAFATRATLPATPAPAAAPADAAPAAGKKDEPAGVQFSIPGK